MFGIADAADCGSSNESAMSGSVNSETSAVYQKRRLSSADVPSHVKQRKLDTENCNNKFYQSDDRNMLRSSSLSKRLQVRQEVITQQAFVMLNDVSHICKKNSSTKDSGSDSHQSESEESSSDNRSSAREDNLILRDFELKEVRVLLHDIMCNEKYRQSATVPPDKHSSASSKKTKSWEVEKIIKKKEHNGELYYLIKWKDWDTKYNTWEPIRNLTNCEDLLREFENKRQKLIELFKRKTNFYPDTSDVENFLVQLQYQGVSIIDATSTAVAAATENSVCSEIRQYFNSSRSQTRKTKIKQQILHMQLIELRGEQLILLYEWQKEMNSITKGKPTIRVENLVDLEGAPQNFYYIDSYIPGANPVIIPDDPPIGCECDVCETSNKSNCCFGQNGATSLPYTSACRVRVPPGTPIYECNKRCVCDMQTCPNRVVQRGSSMQLCIFRTDNGRGWGVRTLRAIKKGTFITQYVGEVINSEEAERRGKEYNVMGRTYLFDLDYNETDGQCPYTVDAGMYGNVSHFINHSCDPNLVVYAVWINCLDPNLPNLALFAIRDIKQNEELTFDYTCQTPRNGNEKMQQQLDKSDAESDVSENKTLCKCGAATCRRYLF